MKSIPRILLILSFLFVALHGWGMLRPSHYNWGFHFLAMYEPLTGALLLLLSLSLFLDPVRRNLIRFAEQCVQPFSRLPVWAGVLFVAGLALAAALSFPVRGTLLGDSRLIMFTLSGIASASDLATHYRNQPLFFLVLEYARNFSGSDPLNTLSEGYKILDLVSLTGFVCIVFLFVRSLDLSSGAKVFAGVLLLAGAGSQLFFGYIENYAPVYALTAAYVTTGWLALQRKMNLIVPLLCFGLLAGLHTGTLVFLPSTLILLTFAWKEKKRAPLFVAALIVAAFLLVEASTHGGFYQFALRLLAVMNGDFIPLITTTPDNPYTLLSWTHIIDWMNLQLLVAPFGLLTCLAVFYLARRSSVFGNPGLLFLVAASLCGLFFSFFLSSVIGLFRDWDLMAGFLIPVVFLSVVLLSQTLQKTESRKIIFVIAVVTLIHTASWIGVNASTDRHLRRAALLTNTSFLGRFAQLLYFDQLANTFWDRKEYARAKNWYEQYLTLDSTNPRSLANLADVYERLGERENYFRLLKRLVGNNTPNPLVYSNIGVEYLERGDTSAAITMYNRALDLDSTLAVIHGNLAIVYLRLKNYDLAMHHCTIALNSGMTDPGLYKCAGLALAFRGDYKRAMTYLDTYLAANPNDPYVRSLRERVNKLLNRS